MSAILAPSQTLWTPPRFGSWWRLPRDWRILFAASKLQRGSDGKLRRGSDGKMKGHDATTASPCCCVTPCANCVADPTPSSFTVTVSGLVVDCGCLLISNPPPRYSKVIGDPNGTYTATQVMGSACEFAVTISASLERYTNSGCTTPDTPATDTLQVLLQLGSGFMNAFVNGPGGGGTLFFNSVVIASGMCTGSRTISNTYTVCSPSLGRNGTMDITPNA